MLEHINVAPLAAESLGVRSMCTYVSISATSTSNGHDLFNSFKRKYAVSFADIGEVDVATKLGFLEEHNFRVFNRKKDRELRNKIAHHDFLLDETGKIKIDGVEVNVLSRHQDLMNFVAKVLLTFCDCLGEITAQNKSFQK